MGESLTTVLESSEAAESAPPAKFLGLDVPLVTAASSAGRRPLFQAPLYLAWETTLKCNARCVHCYSASGPEVTSPDELSTEEARRIIDDLADSGLLILAFSGGEPFLRPDLLQLVEHAAKRGLVVNVATNGATITPARAKQLREAGVSSMTVSLDAANPVAHDAFRARRGLFDRAIRAIRLLVDEGLRVVVSFTPTAVNHTEGPAVVELAFELGAAGVNMSEYVPAGRGARDLALSPDQLRDVVHQWIAMRAEYAGRMQIIWHDCRVALLVPPAEQDRYMGCGAGKLIARLTVDGTLTPCVFLSTPAGNLRTQSFRDVWDNSPVLHTIRDRDQLHGGNCGTCPVKQICGGCRAVSMAYHDDLMHGDAHCWLVPDPSCANGRTP